MANQFLSIERRVLFWLAIAATFIFLIALLREILLPFVLGLGIAYFLDPLADRLEKIGMSRLWATIVIVVFFSLTFALILIFLLPLLADQIMNLAAKIPGYIQVLRELAIQYRQKWFGEISPETHPSLDAALKDIGQKITNWLGGAVTSILSGGVALVNFLSLFLITPVVVFYLLKDWDKMVAHVDQSLPREHAPTIRGLAGKIDEVLSGFVRGQVTVLLLLGTFYIIGLESIGLNFGLLIGLGAGLISFVPFIGSFVGFIVAGAVAVVQFWPDWVPIASVLGVFIAGQLIEGNFLSPMIIGDRVRLHPVWLIFSLFVFGYLFGFVGLLIAVPLAAAIGVLVRFALEKYRESEMYQGTPENDKPVMEPSPEARE